MRELVQVIISQRPIYEKITQPMKQSQAKTRCYTQDVLIIGSGAAGLSLALKLSGQRHIAVISKGPINESATFWAQGGVSAVLSDSDSLESHVNDTLDAGAGLCDEDSVRYTVNNGPEAIQWLSDMGVGFSRREEEENGTDFHLTREGGHSHRRVVHADDATGRAIETTLAEQARQQSTITFYESHIAIDLITSAKLGLDGANTILGAYVLNRKTGDVDIFRAQHVVLATGGANKVYLYTSNPDGSTGDGIAMAWRAGCRVGNMEFMQFHPTCLFHPQAKSFLISEAVRGEGGKLLLPDGSPFMHRFDQRGELAPRDIVARAIDHEMKRLGVDNVYLDISHQPKAFIERHFPTIHQRCLKLGFDMTQEALPVVPAAHYTCGGVVTDLHARTDINGLYAIGETAYTGLHGANRMASNSLLECLVFAKAASEDILAQNIETLKPLNIPAWDDSRVTISQEAIVVSHNWDELRRMMWDYVGIVRSGKRLQRALKRVNLLQKEIDEYYREFKISADLLELRNLAQVAELIIQSALTRKETRGLHYIQDYPETDAQLAHASILVPKQHPNLKLANT